MTGTVAPPISVLVCATGFPRSIDDPHKPFLLDHVRALRDAGARVTVLCPSAPGLPGRERIDGIDVVRFRYAPRSLETLAYDGAMYRRVTGVHALMVPLFVLGFLASAATAARRRQVDVVHGHWWAPSGIVAVVAAWLVGARSVVHLHGSDAAISRGPVVPLARWVLGRASAVVAVSDELAAWAQVVAGREVSVVSMPVASARLPAPSPPDPVGPVLGVGRLVPEKGFDVLVRAVAVTGDAAVIIGDGPERGPLALLAAELGADVTFTGELSPVAVGDWYRRAGVVVVPSRREGFGLVAAEAAACGRAVIGTRVGGIPRSVADGVSGLVIAPDDVVALVAALRAVDPAMGQRGPDQVASLLPADHAAAVLDLYRTIRS